MDYLHFFGLKKINHKNQKIIVSSPSRTFLDCIERPEYSGGWEECLKSLESLAGVKSNELKQLLDKIGILELQNENINSLSGGELQRVFIVRSLMNNPKLLILDEPTAGVDKANVEGFYKTVNELNKEGITIMLITHNMNESQASFTHLLSIHNGEAVMEEVKRGDNE